MEHLTSVLNNNQELHRECKDFMHKEKAGGHFKVLEQQRTTFGGLYTRQKQRQKEKEVATQTLPQQWLLRELPIKIPQKWVINFQTQSNRDPLKCYWPMNHISQWYQNTHPIWITSQKLNKCATYWDHQEVDELRSGINRVLKFWSTQDQHH